MRNNHCIDPRRERLIRAYGRRVSGLSPEQIAREFDEYVRLNALHVKWDANNGKWKVVSKAPQPRGAFPIRVIQPATQIKN